MNCTDCKRNDGKEATFNTFCSICNVMHPSASLSFYEKVNRSNNCQKVFMCSYYRNHEDHRCKFAYFNTSEENKKFGRDKICMYADHIADNYILCECEDAQKEID